MISLTLATGLRSLVSRCVLDLIWEVFVDVLGNPWFMAAGNQMPSIVTGPWQFVRPRSPGRWTEGMERISQLSLCGKEQTAFRLLVGWMGMDGDGWGETEKERLRLRSELLFPYRNGLFCGVQSAGLILLS